MAEQDFFEFSAKFDIELEKSSMSQATKALDDFYKKYSNRKMKIDTSDMVKAAQNGISAVQKLYKQGVNEIENDNISWWDIESGLNEQFNDARNKMKNFFEEAKIIFSDGSIFSALDDNLADVFSEKFAKGITVIASDLGERVQYLKNQISDTINELSDLNAIQVGWRGQTANFSGGDMSEDQLQERIDLLKELMEWQKELESFNNKKFTYDTAPTGMTTESIKYNISSLKDTLQELEDYNSQVEEQYKITTKQLERRRKLIAETDAYGWDSNDQDEAKRNIKDEEYYNKSIERLKSYIADRESLIRQLEDSESELFRADGIEQYVLRINAQIQEYQDFIDELENIKLNGRQDPDGINLSGIIKQLQEIRNAILDIKDAFEPLTTALSSEDNAIHKMLTSSVEDLDTFKAKLSEVYQMIDTLSNKQFNVTNVMSTGNSTQNDLDQIRQFRKEAKELLNQVQELYVEATTTANKIKGTPEGLSEFLNFSATMGEFDFNDLAKRIKSRSALSLGVVIDELNEWKKVLLQFNSLRNNVEAGSFNVNKYSDTSSKVSIGSKTTDKDQDVIDDRSVDNDDILNKVKSLSEQIEAELTSIRAKMEETFNFDTLDLNTEKIKSMTDAIYQQFVELQAKINALDLNINVPTVIENNKTDKDNIDAASDAMKEEGDSAADAVPKKNAFTEANKAAAQSAKETEDATKGAAEGIAAEAKAIEQSAGKIVEANDKLDKIKYVDSIAEDGSQHPISKTTTSTDKRERAYETETTHYRYDEDSGQYVADAVTVVKDFKKRATELKKEATKIELAKKTVAKFLSQFDNKTAGHGKDIAGYNELKGFDIKSLDDIEEAMQKMIALDTKYNELTKNFRKGTKSMNPFVNAFNSMDEMRNKVKKTQLDFENLKSPTDTLRDQVKGLPQLLEALNKALTPDENGAINIENIAKAYGNLNAAIKQANSSIGLQSKEEKKQTAATKELYKLYDEQAKSAVKIAEYRQKLNSGELGKEEARLVAAQLHQEKEQFASIQQRIRGYGDLYNSIEQVATITHELYMAELKISAAQEKQAKKAQQEDEKARKSQEEKEQKDVEVAYNKSLQLLEKIYNIKKKLVGVDEESSHGQELNRKLAALQEEYDTTSKILSVEQNRALFKERIKLQKELTTKEDEHDEAARNKQEIDDTEYLLSLYKDFTDAAQKLKKMQNDPSGNVHDDAITTELQNLLRAKQALLDLGIDVKNIADSELLTEGQINALLEARIEHQKKIQKIKDNFADKAATKEQKEQQRQDRQNQNYGKTIYNRELRNSETINAKARDLGDDISPDFAKKIQQYQEIVDKLKQLRDQFASDPKAFENSALKNEFQSTALEAENLRKEILGVFKESQKLNNIDGLLGELKLEPSDLDNVKVKMMEFANELTEGQFKFESFNAAGTEMYGVLDRGNGVVEKITVALNQGTNTLHAFTTGTKQVSNSWDKLGASLKSGVKQIVGQYVGFHEALQAFRNGVNYVKDIDLALTELKKVTDETEETYERFLQTASQSSNVIGSTVSDFTEATANFARLGYNINESTKLAETAIVYRNVADGLDTIEESTDSIISTMMAFGIEANDTMGIVDKFNAVGNSFAITSAGIGDALQRSASALYEAGNTIDESIAIVTAANSVIQNPEQVGTALKTLALRLRGAKVELQEAGLDAENMAESTSTLQAKLKALTHGKVDIMLDADTFKSTTQILREMSAAWEDMTDIERASALELMGGKRQANILSSLISNFETVEDVIKTSMNSSGSAMAENEKWLDSIAGKTEQFSNTLQTFWMNFINANVVKDFVDFGTNVIKFLDSVPGKVTAIISALLAVTKFKGFSIIGLGKDAGKSLQNYQQAILKLQSLQSIDIGMDGSYNTAAVVAYAQAVDGLTAKKQAELLATAGLNKEQVIEVMTRNNIDAAVAKEIASKMNLTSATKALHTATVAEVLTTEMATDATQEKVIADFLAANGSKKLTAELLNQMVQQKILTAEQAAGILANYKLAFSWKALGNSIKAAFLYNPVGVILTVITSVVSLVSWLGSLRKSTEEVAEAANEVISKYKETQSTLQEQKQTIDELAAAYERLSDGVDLNTNENISLTTESYKEYLDVCNDIADMYPNLVTGFDAQGNAILSLKGNVDLLIQAYKEAAQAARQDVIAKGDDIFDVFKNNVFDSKQVYIKQDGLAAQIEVAERFLNAISSGDKEVMQTVYDSMFDNQHDALMKMIESAGLELNDFRNFWTGKVDVESYKATSQKLQSFIKATTTEINTETNKVKSLIDAYLGEDLDYNSISERSRNFVNQIVSGLDAEFIKNFDNADSLYNWIKSNIVNAFTDPSVVDTINNLSDLQQQLTEGDIIYSDYKKQLGEYLSEIQNKFDDDALAQIKIGVGIDEESLQVAATHVIDLLGGDSKFSYNLEKVSSLSVEDLQIAGQLEVPEGTILSWQELKDKIEETKIAATQDFDITNFTDAISAHSAVISEYQEALQKLGKGSFTMDDFMSLIKKYPELAKGVDISSNAFYGLSRNLNRAIKTSTKSFIRDLKELRVSLVAAGKSTDAIDQLIEAIGNMPDNTLDDIIEKYSTLANKIREAKTAQDKLLASMEENPNEGYETRGEAMEYMKEAMEKGEIGSESNLWNVAEKYGFTYDSAKTINENADALAKFIATRERWFQADDDGDDRTKDDGYSYEGTENFIEDVESAVKNNAELQQYLTWDYDENAGTLNFDFKNKNWDTIVSILSKTKELAGLTSDEFSDLMIQVGQYFGIDWGNYNDAVDHLNEIANGTDDAKTKTEEYGKYMQDYFGKNTKIDLTARPMVGAAEMQSAGWEGFEEGDYATVYSGSYSSDDDSVTVSVTPILPDGNVLDPKSLEKYATEIANGTDPAEVEIIYKDKNGIEKKYTGEDVFLNKFKGTNMEGLTKEEQASQYGVKLSEAQAGYDQLRDKFNINATINEKGIQGLAEIEEIQDSIKQKADGTVVINEDAFRDALTGAEYTEDQIDIIIDKIKKLDKEAFNFDPLNIEEVIGDTGSGLAGLKEIEKVKDSLTTDESTGLTVLDTDMFTSVLQEAGYTEEQIDSLIKKIQEYNGVVSVSGSTDPLGLSNASFTIDSLKASLSTLGIQFDETLGTWFDGKKDVKINVQDLVTTLKEKGWTDEAIKNYCAKLSETNLEGFNIKVNQDEIDAAIQKANEVPEEEKTEYKITGTGIKDLKDINSELSKIPAKKETEIVVNETTNKTTVVETINKDEEEDKPFNLFDPSTWKRGVVNGTAHAQGSWGAPKTETSLVGELGPEILVRGNRWTTVGENGAEFTQVKKGDIIFNHKQTESLLKNGYVTSRGKAYASGTAYVSTDSKWASYDFSGSGGYQKFDVNGNVVGYWGDLSGLSDAASDAADSAEEFAETLDWIEIRMEEIDEVLGLLGAKLENAVYYTDKNNLIDEMIGVNKQKYANSLAGADYYEKYINKYWNQIPAKYQEWAKNGEIAVTDFAGDANEAVVEAIEKYREYAQKAADLTRQAEETITEIRDLAIQRIDNARESGEVRAAVEDSQTEKLQNRVDLIEEQGNIAGEAYYHAMMENSNKKIDYLGAAKEAMQAEFDAAVRNGEIIRGSNEWYEMVNQLYEIDAEIAEATIELEEFQNAINDIYWDNLENLTNQTGYLKDQTQSLIDLMEKSGELIAKPEKKKYKGSTVEYWTADDVKWTDEGLASLGLYAQQMEIAEFEARQYAEAIDDLNDQYAEGRYSESEYLEKLEELTSEQYDSIDAYYEAQDAIVELNEARVDMIKEGIEKEIEAYEELIDKKKEELDAEKDLYDFQKSTMQQQKNIAEIERKLAALANDNSLSAAAKRKKLEAELAEAQYELQETYYDRSVENKQNALDKELEDFQAEKDAEITKWEEYLDNVELVVAESLNIIQTNASGIYDTLNQKAQDYDLTLSESIMSPWKDGALAISDYQDTFDTAMSSTMDQLTALKDKWRDVIEEMARASEVDVGKINEENEDYADAKKFYGNPLLQGPSSNNNNNNNNNQPAQKSITVGGKINAGNAKIYENSAGGGGGPQYFKNDPIYVVVQDYGNYVAVRHHSASSGITGFFKKSDVKAYAKGTTGVDKNQLAWIDELGEELVMHAAGNGKLAFLSRGSAVIPHDLSENLMEWGQLDPTSMLEQNRPTVGVAPQINNTEINIDMSIAEVVHIDEVTGDTLPDLTKAVEKQLDAYMQKLNGAIRRYTR